ncbi:MAG TPA: hypothetical protein VFB63_06460 [Bryobacteraceae bacterium]|nr:hypothetical protein [Bryobacteraceae bacterium]
MTNTQSTPPQPATAGGLTKPDDTLARAADVIWGTRVEIANYWDTPRQSGELNRDAAENIVRLLANAGFVHATMAPEAGRLQSQQPKGGETTAERVERRARRSVSSGDLEAQAAAICEVDESPRIGPDNSVDAEGLTEGATREGQDSAAPPVPEGYEAVVNLATWLLTEASTYTPHEAKLATATLSLCVDLTKVNGEVEYLTASLASKEAELTAAEARERRAVGEVQDMQQLVSDAEELRNATISDLTGAKAEVEQARFMPLSERLPGDGVLVELEIADEDVAIDSWITTAFRRDDGVGGSEWWAGIPGHYIPLHDTEDGWAIKGWRPIRQTLSTPTQGADSGQ